MTAQVTLADLPVLAGRLVLPLSGSSVGFIELDGDALAIGPTDLTIEGDGEPAVTFAVCVARVALVEGRIHALIVGGRSGGLSRSPLAVDVAAVHYDGDPTPASAWEVLSDLAALASEALDASQAAALQTFGAASWLREAGPSHRAFARALGFWGLSARFLPNGEIWAGVDAWPQAASEPLPVDRIDDGWCLHVAPNSASTQPGVVVKDKRILRVEYLFGDALRALLHYREDP